MKSTVAARIAVASCAVSLGCCFAATSPNQSPASTSTLGASSVEATVISIESPSSPNIASPVAAESAGKLWGSEATSMVQLPARVSVAPGALTLWADFSDMRGDWIVLYLVNDSARQITIGTLDGDLDLKLEVRRQDGQWERAQDEIDRSCGCCYVAVTLPPKHFLRRLGYHPRSGREAVVRYRSYQESSGPTLISNSGPGFVVESDVEKARRDGMSQRRVPRLLREVLSGERLPRILDPVSPERFVAALRLVQTSDPAPHFRDIARNNATYWRGETAPVARMAAVAIDQMLAADWPTAPRPEAIAERCVLALTTVASSSQPFGAPEKDRLLVWSILEDLVYGSAPDAYSAVGTNFAYHEWKEAPLVIGSDRQAAIVREARRVVTNGPFGEQGFAAAVLAAQGISGKIVTDDEYATLVGHPNPSVWRWIAMALVKRGERDRLIDAAAFRPPDDQLHLLWILQHDRPAAPSPREEKLWDDCIRQFPGPVAYVLSRTVWDYSVLPARITPAPLRFREPILAFLRRELSTRTATSGTQSGYDLNAALRVTAAWDQAADAGLLQGFLNHTAINSADLAGTIRASQGSGFPTVAPAARSPMSR